MTKVIAILAFLREVWEAIKEFMRLQKDHEIEVALDSKERNIEKIIDSKSAGHRSKFSGSDGVFDIPDEDKN